MPTPLVSRRSALKGLAAAGLFAPFAVRTGSAAPGETLRHASFGSSGMAMSDIRSLAASPHLKLVAVADVDLRNASEIEKLFPGVKVYQDWRVLLDEEKGLDSVNVSTPDHMHGPITLRALRQGLHTYTQKPLTQTIFEARGLTRLAAESKLVTQMGIQIHSHPVHKAVVAIVQDGAIGKVKEVHSWSGKAWGDRAPRPTAPTRSRKGSTGTSGWASPPNGHMSRGTTTRPTGASGSTSAPARSATWAATSSTPSSPRSP